MLFFSVLSLDGVWFFFLDCVLCFVTDEPDYFVPLKEVSVVVCPSPGYTFCCTLYATRLIGVLSNFFVSFHIIEFNH